MTIEDVIRDERRRAHKKRDLAEAFRDEANKIPALKHAKRHDQIADWPVSYTHLTLPTIA